MNGITQFWQQHGTKALGIAQTIVAGSVTIPDLVAPGALKWVAFVNLVLGALTVGRGFANSAEMQKLYGPKGD